MKTFNAFVCALAMTCSNMSALDLKPDHQSVEKVILPETQMSSFHELDVPSHFLFIEAVRAPPQPPVPSPEYAHFDTTDPSLSSLLAEKSTFSQLNPAGGALAHCAWWYVVGQTYYALC